MTREEQEIEMKKRVLARWEQHGGRWCPLAGMVDCFYKQVLDVAPEKRVFYVLSKWVSKGWWEYGIHAGCGFPTQEGLVAFREARK